MEFFTFGYSDGNVLQKKIKKLVKIWLFHKSYADNLGLLINHYSSAKLADFFLIHVFNVLLCCANVLFTSFSSCICQTRIIFNLNTDLFFYKY